MAEHDSDREGREGREGHEGRESREPAESLGSLGSGADAGPDPDGKSGQAEGSGAALPEPPELPSAGPSPAPAPQKGVPFDEEAAWAAIVAGYGEEPPDPPGTRPYRPVEDLKLPDFPLGPGTDPNTGPGTPPSGTQPGADGGPASAAPGTNDSAPRTEPPAERPKEDRPAPARPLGGSVSFAPGVGPRDYTPREPSDEDFDEDDEGHFVPPEPPPLPDSDVTSKFAWLAVIGGPVLLLLAVLFGWDMTWWLTTLGIGGFLGGFATLVTRMKPDDEDDDPGRGAVV